MTPRILRRSPRAPRAIARLLFSLAAALTVALTLSACGNVNAGSAGMAEMQRVFADDPAIESLDLGGANDLPWVGVVSGDVVAKRGLDEAELRGLIDRLAQFSAAYDGARISVNVQSDGVQFPVASDKSEREAYLSFGLALRDDPRVLVTEFSPGRSLSVTAADPEAVFALASELPGELATLPDKGEVEIDLASVNGEVTLEGTPGSWTELAARVWLGAQQYGVTRVAATPETLQLRVEREQDVEDAQNFARYALERSPLQLTVSSDMLQLAEGASGASARTLLAALDDDIVSRVATNWSDDSTLHVTARTLDDAQPLADAISALRESSVFGTVAIFVGADPDGAGADSADGDDTAGRLVETSIETNVLMVYADPRELPAQVANALQVLAAPGAESVQIAHNRVDLTVSESVGEKNLGRFAPVLKSIAAAGDWVCVAIPSGAQLCTTAMPEISAEDLGYAEHESARDFIKQWNAAPAMR